MKSERYKYFFDSVVSNKKRYAEIKWSDYSIITNKDWNEIYKIIKYCMDSQDWERHNAIKYSDLKTKMSSTHKLDLKEALESKLASNIESTTSRSGTEPREKNPKK